MSREDETSGMGEMSESGAARRHGGRRGARCKAVGMDSGAPLERDRGTRMRRAERDRRGAAAGTAEREGAGAERAASAREGTRGDGARADGRVGAMAADGELERWRVRRAESSAPPPGIRAEPARGRLAAQPGSRGAVLVRRLRPRRRGDRGRGARVASSEVSAKGGSAAAAADDIPAEASAEEIEDAPSAKEGHGDGRAQLGSHELESPTSRADRGATPCTTPRRQSLP